MPTIGNRYYPPHVHRLRITDPQLRSELAALINSERQIRGRFMNCAMDKIGMKSYLQGRIDGLRAAFEHRQMVRDGEREKKHSARRSRRINRLIN